MPPELQLILDQVGNYYFWFEINTKVVKGEELVQKLLDEINEKYFIKILQN